MVETDWDEVEQEIQMGDKDEKNGMAFLRGVWAVL